MFPMATNIQAARRHAINLWIMFPMRFQMGNMGRREFPTQRKAAELVARGFVRGAKSVGHVPQFPMRFKLHRRNSSNLSR